MKNLKWVIQLEINVSPVWVADGADFGNEGYKEAFSEAVENMLPYAYPGELETIVKVIKSHDPEIITGIQNGSIEIDD